MKKLASILFVALAVSAQAQIASDNSDNYVTFGNGTNGGSGFLAWSISSNDNGTSIFAGSFLGDSTQGAGNINVNGDSFGLYANPPGAFVNADRAFASILAVGDTFTFELALNFDNGNKGFNLYAGSQGQILNFNVGGGASVNAGGGTLLVPGPGAGYNYGGNDAVLDVSITITSGSALSYNISRTSSQGFQGTLFSGTLNGLTEGVTGFRFYASGTDDGAAQNNLYFNNLTVVPEPSVVALLGLGGLVTGLVVRRRLASGK